MALLMGAPAKAQSAFIGEISVKQAHFGEVPPPIPHPSDVQKQEKPAKSTDETAQAEYLYCQSKGLIQGNIGTFIGLTVALLGLFQFTVQAKTSGLLVLLAGVLVTLSPSIYISFMKGLRSTFSGVEGSAITPPPCPD